MADNKINVGGRLHSIATGNVLGGANEIFDDSKNKKQSDINTETYSLVNDVNERLSGLSPDQQSALNVATKATNNETKLGYYVCGTDGNVATKVISDATGYILSKGGSMKVKMTNANTANNATLNINSTGAKALYYAGERASANNSWEAGETVEVYYDGTSFYANSVAGGSGSGDGAFDISAKTGNTYETLSAALTAANSILSASKKKGGMSIKFIQLTPATYSVIKTEGVAEQPTGTEVQEALSLESGTYTAAQMTGVTPPTSGSVTYYLAVTETVDEQEVTTYTTWVITKATNDVQKYVQYRYMETVTTAAAFTNVVNWQGVDDEPTAGSNNLIKSGGVANGLGNLNLLTGLELKESPKDLAVGTIYDGALNTNIKDCLSNINYIKVLPNLFLGIIRATDIRVRITQYDENKRYITQSAYSNITSVITQQNTKFIRISASYANRGFSDEHPVTINDYQEGDFGILIPQSDKIDNEPIAGSDNLVKSGGVENFVNSRLHITLSSNQLPNIDTQAGTLDLGSDPNFYIGNNVYYSSDFESESDYRAIPLQIKGSTSGRRKLVFNIETIKFKTINFNTKQLQSEVLVGSFVVAYSETGYIPGSFVSANLPFKYAVDGVPFNKQQLSLLEITRILYGDRYIISSRLNGIAEYANFDTAAGTLTFPTDSWLCMSNSNGYRFLLPSTPISYMAGETSVVFLMYNLSTHTLTFKTSSSTLSPTEVLLAVVRKIYSTTNKGIAEVSCCFNYTIDGIPFNKKQKQYLDEIKGTSTQYIGERLPINNSYIKTLFTLSNFGSATYPVNSQGMDIYDNKYLFQGNQSGEDRSIYILDLEQKTILGNFLFTEAGTWHMNNINCAIKETDTDKFPLIYLSECYGTHRCAVVKISDGADSYMVKQLITFNTSLHYGGGSYAFDWFLDIENNLIYCYGNTASRGSVEIVKFNLPSLSDAAVTLTDNDVLDSFIVSGIGIYQGSKLINGKLVCPEGFGNAEYPAYISVIDLTKKQIVTRVPWNYGEPESAAIYENGILVVNNATNPTYRLLTI